MASKFSSIADFASSIACPASLVKAISYLNLLLSMYLSIKAGTFFFLLNPEKGLMINLIFCWLKVTGYWLLVTGYWLLVTGYWLKKLFFAYFAIFFLFIFQSATANRLN